MSDQNDNTPSSRSAFLRPLPIGLVVAALGITAVLILGNGGAPEAGSCAIQPDAAAAIDEAAVGELAALNATATGRSYADLGFIDETGRPMTLADFAGKPLIVNFWATWCVPCREEMPELNALAAAYSEDVFSVVAVNLDTGGDGTLKAQEFLKEEALGNLPLYADPSFAAFELLKKNGVALGLPATLLVDEKGCELAVLQGPAAWNSEDAHAVIDTLVTVAGGGT